MKGTPHPFNPRFGDTIPSVSRFIFLCLIDQADSYLWCYLLQHYHYLGYPRLVGEYLRYVACMNGQVDIPKSRLDIRLPVTYEVKIAA